MLKKIVKRLIGLKVLGAIDYYRYPELRQSWGGAFNGQLRRKEMVDEIFHKINIQGVVETGTYRGTTTEYFKGVFRGPIITIEEDKRLYGYASMRFMFKRDIQVFNGDSREVLRILAKKHWMADKILFFYLDAHWKDDLPLQGELNLIFENWPSSIVLVDDFMVPDDPGYGYDDYGENQRLTVEYTRTVVDKYRLACFFPFANSNQETGARRGCILFVSKPDMIDKISNLSYLRIGE